MQNHFKLVMRRRLSVLVLALLAPLAVAAGARCGVAGEAGAALPDLTSYQFVSSGPRDGALDYLSAQQLAARLKDYDVVFVGEWHDHAGNHLAEMALFRALFAQGGHLALSMEQFERDVQPVVDDYLAGRIGEENFMRRGRAWSNYAQAYRPLVEFAKEHGLGVIAAEAPTRIVRCVGQRGPDFLSHLAPDKRGWAAATLHLGEGPYRDKFFRFLAEDGEHVAASGAHDEDAAKLRSFAAQVTRDDTMAESIARRLHEHPGDKVMHVTGEFHVAESLGTVERLKMLDPALKIAVVEPIQVDNREAVPAGIKLPPGEFGLLLRALPKSYVNEAEEKAAQGASAMPPRKTCNL